MEKTNKEIKALDMYYEIAQKEYDDTFSYYDVIDNKVSIFIAIAVAIPSFLLSFVKIHPGLVGKISFGLYVLGFIMLMWVFYHIFQALRIRKVMFGALFNEFQEACKYYENDAIKESQADEWLKAAKENHDMADAKATQLRRLHWPLLLETGFFIAATIVAVADL